MLKQKPANVSPVNIIRKSIEVKAKKDEQKKSQRTMGNTHRVLPGDISWCT